MEKVCVHFAEGFEEIEAITIVDILRRAEIDVKMVSITKSKIVTGAHKIKITTDLLFEEVNYDEVSMIILPGGMPGSKNLKEHVGLNEKIKEFYKKGKKLGAICAAPMVYGGLGILKGEKATSYPGFEVYLDGATIVNEEVVTSNKIITSQGPGTAIKFALKIVSDLKGEKLANSIKEGMIVK
ncbi:DJ-1 family glyoxalase III [Haliovirga abyssi]|uniref:Thiazole biosynthesis protein ThiJ n=1 Tax=Haliovirga abyssi TaxID=2996794 RepID=A0AAU9DKS9_9FUSO|nr:DJ-1 family glyoxalase III [Haliovirga abyssi]BDU51539.1 thiazole biosynthesis protein ThiJ [Haliovirga abyssi]